MQSADIGTLILSCKTGRCVNHKATSQHTISTTSAITVYTHKLWFHVCVCNQQTSIHQISNLTKHSTLSDNH